MNVLVVTIYYLKNPNNSISFTFDATSFTPVLTVIHHIIPDKELFYILQYLDDIVETTDTTNTTTNILSDEEIETFNAYLEENDLPTAFRNTDFVNIYKKIVGNTSRSNKIQKWIEHQK